MPLRVLPGLLGFRKNTVGNQLDIERPIETVACAVKPPGTSMEFEIKRTGLRATFPLTALLYL